MFLQFYLPTMRKILVTGANGQLGKELQDIEVQYPQFKFFFVDRQILDITKREKVYEAFEQIKPAYVVNCAAFTAVDNAETESGHSFACKQRCRC